MPARRSDAASSPSNGTTTMGSQSRSAEVTISKRAFSAPPSMFPDELTYITRPIGALPGRGAGAPSSPLVTKARPVSFGGRRLFHGSPQDTGTQRRGARLQG